MSLKRAVFLAGTVVATAALVPAQSGPGLLITPRELASRLTEPNLVVLQTGQRNAYDAGHIEGARFVSLQDLSAPRVAGALSLELPDEAELRSRLEQLGIGDQSRVVVVFGADFVTSATRVAWVLQTAGLGARTQLLDGGLRAWQAAGLPVTTAEPAPATRGRLTLPSDRSLRVDHEWVQTRSKGPGIRLIDGRAPMFYDGPGMTGPNGHDAGHIAGAKNIPFNTLANDSIKFLPVAELRRLFSEAGVQPGDTIAAYCHIGQQATMVLLSARLLGHPVKLYDGSMDDWEKRKLPLVNEQRPPDSQAPEGRP